MLLLPTLYFCRLTSSSRVLRRHRMLEEEALVGLTPLDIDGPSQPMPSQLPHGATEAFEAARRKVERRCVSAALAVDAAQVQSDQSALYKLGIVSGIAAPLPL